MIRADPSTAQRRWRGRERTGSPQRAPVASSLLPRNPESWRKFAAASDTSASLESLAGSYLSVNCAHCHTVNGGGNSAMDFEWNVSIERMHAINQPPQHGDLGITDAKVIAPGAPARSVLIPRMGTRAPGQMPPIGTRTADSEGLRLMAEWIASLRE